VPIMNGCNKFCTYCIVPHVRGREISRPVEAIVKEVTDLGVKGFKEITLLGQNVNSYGLDFKDGTDFGTLVDALDGIPGIERIRYMTSHPQDMSKSMIDALGRSSNIVTHLHLPIQSGSNRILKKMNRHYTVEHYKELLSYCREKIKDVVVTTDIIVGFPGETAEEFQETYDFIVKHKFSELHVFPYSQRIGTPAARMDDQIDESIKNERVHKLIALSDQLAKEYASKFENEVLEVIPEEVGETKDTLVGYADNYMKVEFEGSEDLIGEIVKVKINKADYPINIGSAVRIVNHATNKTEEGVLL
ncbi:MAG: MiaB/RimO family radical SAM methylthiotransferase, partial [Staphylococcus sp.]|nr:MiaB/RimO family radical SAM methylthiotransferase [Staphylococcus sp.]